MMRANRGIPFSESCVFSGLLILALLAGCHRGGQANFTADSEAYPGADRPDQVSYAFIDESGGTKPKAGATILLSFAPDGVAYLYANRPTSRVAYHGHWTYTNGEMTLKFATSAFNVDARFPLDLRQQTVSLPFQVFAHKPGTSRWNAESMSVVEGIYARFFAAATDTDHPDSHDEAVQRALDYATARIALERGGKAARSGILDAVIPAAGAQSYDTCGGEEPSEAYRMAEDSLLLVFPCGATLLVWLAPVYDNPRFPPLYRAPLSGDPRVFIDPFPPGNGADDPPSKTVMVFAPFLAERDGDEPTAPGWRWQQPDGVYVSSWSSFSGRQVTVSPQPLDFALLPALRAHGYDTRWLLINEDASVKSLVQGLTENPTPGILLIRSHGGTDGAIATSDGWDLSPVPGHRTKSVWPGFWDYLKGLRAAGLGDLVDYGRPAGSSGPWYPKTLRMGILPHTYDPKHLGAYVGVTPSFWLWARETRHVDLHRSLVFVGACNTDAVPNANYKYPATPPFLRDAIQARAYFAWNAEERAGLIDRTMRYLVAQLTHPTHTAEEAFNNLMRVGNRRNMIYVEDKLLDEQIGEQNGEQNGEPNSDFTTLNAYGWDGEKLVSYRTAGWFGTEAARAARTSPSGTDHFGGAQVWWILFAARWSQKSEDGETKILNCYHEIWSTGTMGALKSPQCNAYNGGELPTADEVGYAMYTLRGKANPGFSGDLVPRWTLDDAASH